MARDRQMCVQETDVIEWSARAFEWLGVSGPARIGSILVYVLCYSTWPENLILYIEYEVLQPACHNTHSSRAVQRPNCSRRADRTARRAGFEWPLDVAETFAKRFLLCSGRSKHFRSVAGSGMDEKYQRTSGPSDIRQFVVSAVLFSFRVCIRRSSRLVVTDVSCF